MSTLGSSGAVARASSVPSRDTVSTASSGPASRVRSGTVGSSGSGVSPWYSGLPEPVPLIVYVHAPASGSSTSTRPIARTCRRSFWAVTTMPSSGDSGQFGSTVASTTAPAGPVGPVACAWRATAQVTVTSSASGRYAVRLSNVDSGRAGSFGQITRGSFTDTGANGSASAHTIARSPVSAANSISGCRAGGGSAIGAAGDAEGSDDSGRSVSGAEVTRASSRTAPTIGGPGRRSARLRARVGPVPRQARTVRDGILDRRGGRRPAARGGRSWPAAPGRGGGHSASSAWPSWGPGSSSTPIWRSSPAPSPPPSTPISAPSGHSRWSRDSACSCPSSRRPPGCCRCRTGRAACCGPRC